MIAVASIGYIYDHGIWPLQISFGEIGHEVTVDEMLEGRGHAALLVDQLVALVCGMICTDTPIELIRPIPPGVAARLVRAGFYVALI